MPDYCAAYGCSNARSLETRKRGITFHRIPSDLTERKKWVTALRRKDFEPSMRTVICSDHFRPEEFDRTGQTVRIRSGVVPSIFNFPEHVKKHIATKLAASKQQLPYTMKNDRVLDVIPSNNNNNVEVDHCYAFTSPETLKEKLNAAEQRIKELEREIRNTRDRERRSKSSLKSAVAELKDKNLITEELQHKLEIYSDLPIKFFHKEGSTCTS